MSLNDSSKHINERAKLVQQLRKAGIQDELVLQAMQTVPRHLFLEPGSRDKAYENTALPIECGQTISQPYIVAKMTAALCRGQRLSSVLEIGTGSGYQAAILSLVADKVYTIERIESLATTAINRFETLGFSNIQVIYGDGYDGFEQASPYSGIIVTAAAEEIPKVLMEQLADGGRMVIPVGGRGAQDLMLVIRKGDNYIQKSIEGVIFVPFLHGKR